LTNHRDIVDANGIKEPLAPIAIITP